MEESQQQQTLQTDAEVTLVVSGEEATLVSPRFDDEETLVARPVVPLDAEEAEAAHAPGLSPQAAAAGLPAYARRLSAPRRSWMLALVLVSVLVGGVLGGAGLYIYQRQSQDERAVATPPTETPAETQQQAEPAPEPTVEASNVTQAEAPASVAESTAAPAPTPAAVDEATAARPARETETVPAAVRREATDANRNAGTPKRGKKGENDDEVERPRPVARASAPAPREARRMDTILYRPRRERARRAAGDTDRLRRIFEGTPE